MSGGGKVMSSQERLAAVAGRLAAWAEAQGKQLGGARVRLDRPLEAPAPPADLPLSAALVAAQGYAGGPRPQAPYAPDLSRFQAQVAECQACPLGAKRKRLVFGDGNARAELVFIGDAPGREEDQSGKPFMDEAGQLLDRIIAAMGYKRGQVYLVTLVKCRPASNHEPAQAELDACRPYLDHQLLSLLKPKAIVTLGAMATQALLGAGKPLAERRGHWAQWQGLKVLPTWHPADLLRDPGLKRAVWDDMRLVAQSLQQPGGGAL
jgi:DNA polymerase